jgi:Flp pilus assembly protein TadG
MKKSFHARRRGNILVLTAVLMVGLIGFIALAVDVGYIYTVRNELQRSADAAAIAATWELCDRDGNALNSNATNLTTSARSLAVEYAAYNKVGATAPQLASNDVVVGYMANPSNPSEPMVATPPGKLPNAVQVRVQRTNAQNGEVSLFFARILGVQSTAAEAQATAAVLSGFKGFKTPTDGSNLGILPYALDLVTWNALLAGTGTDNYNYNPNTEAVTAGGDGIKECNLFPQGTGSPGNRGTIDIGSSNNSTADIARQIVDGVSPADMAFHSGELLFDGDGEIILNGDTGISAGVKDELASIIGEPRCIPIFSTVAGPGNNAQYTIVKWVGVRVMAVKLTGSMASKYVMIQPCNFVTKGGIYEAGATGSQYIYSPVWLVR